MTRFTRCRVSVIALALLAGGCGDNENGTIVISSVPTATPGDVVVTPTVGVPTSAATPTIVGPLPTPTPVSGAVPASAAAAAGSVVPFLRFGIGLVTGTGGGAQAATATVSIREALEIDACPNGGTREVDDFLTDIEIFLDECRFTDAQLGDFLFDGSIDIDLLGAMVDFDVTVEELGTGMIIDFLGTIAGTPVIPAGGFVLNGGPILISTDEGDFEFTFVSLTVDADGNVVSGGGTVEDADDNVDLATLGLTLISGGSMADVVATFDDASVANFLLDLVTGALTPAS